MTHPATTVEEAGRLVDSGVSHAETARRLGVSRAAIRDWLRQGTDVVAAARLLREGCTPCRLRAVLPRERYAYLLGMYLGDGSISAHPRGVYKLRISCADAYPAIKAECAEAIKTVMPSNRVGFVQCEGCTEVYAFSKHWPCLFPQHGLGPKHGRPIVLQRWQLDVVDRYPEALLRGLIHSDGCRNQNVVKGKAYPRYQFTNASDDIRGIFRDACKRLGVFPTQDSYRTMAVARRADVAKLDEFIGAKH